MTGINDGFSDATITIAKWLEMKVQKDLGQAVDLSKSFLMKDNGGKVGIADLRPDDFKDMKPLKHYLQSHIENLRAGSPTLQEMKLELENYHKQNESE